MLWNKWWKLARELKGACSRQQSFLWMVVFLMGISIRADASGVTSIVRVLGLVPACYDRILDFLHSPALCLDTLTVLWCRLVFRLSGLLRVNERIVLVGDGIKIAKSGKKMPAVKKLHQQSESNTKPEFIFGHSCQAVAALVGSARNIFAIPLCCRIHEGVSFSNRDRRTLLDRMILMLDSLRIQEPFLFIADAYYATGKIIDGMLARGCHLISCVKSNAVAFEPYCGTSSEDKLKKRGRPRIYGKKIPIRSLVDDPTTFECIESPIYGESHVIIAVRTVDLLWRPAGVFVRFVIAIHPQRGTIFLLSTDRSLSALEIIRLYGLRFKIELTFKQAVRVVGTFAYHFWMSTMSPRSRRGKTQFLHRKPKVYRDAVVRKIAAYHRHIQLGLIAQGLLQILSISSFQDVWRSFGSWMRTMRPGFPPSELVVAVALRNTLPEFLADTCHAPILKKFLRNRIDIHRLEGLRLIT